MPWKAYRARPKETLAVPNRAHASVADILGTAVKPSLDQGSGQEKYLSYKLEAKSQCTWHAVVLKYQLHHNLHLSQESIQGHRASKL